MARRVFESEDGVVVYQVTEDASLKDNIYCERSYCSPDSAWFIYERQVPPEDPEARRHAREPWKFLADFVACRFGDWESRVVGRGYSLPDVSKHGNLYYVRLDARGNSELVRVEYPDWRSEAIPIRDGTHPYTGVNVAPGERMVTYAVPLSYAPQLFGVLALDVATGMTRLVCAEKDICNPHTQFDQNTGEYILVQRNRGCQFTPQGEPVSWLGPEGCTLFQVRVADGRITPLQVGPPYTASCQGHQQWIADTDTVLLTTCEPSTGDTGGNLLTVRAGEPARLVSRTYDFSHIHASVSGQYFCSDIRGVDIVVGSIRTGRWVKLFNVGQPMSDVYESFAHAHPYLSPDARWAVFNATLTGRPQVYAASIPPELLEKLEQP